eukprot:4471082-Karenia_brevis.AAC.1
MSNFNASLLQLEPAVGLPCGRDVTASPSPAQLEGEVSDAHDRRQNTVTTQVSIRSPELGITSFGPSLLGHMAHYIAQYTRLKIRCMHQLPRQLGIQ